MVCLYPLEIISALKPCSLSLQSRIDQLSTAVFFIMTYAHYREKHFARELATEDRKNIFHSLWV